MTLVLGVLALHGNGPGFAGTGCTSTGSWLTLVRTVLLLVSGVLELVLGGNGTGCTGTGSGWHWYWMCWHWMALVLVVLVRNGTGSDYVNTGTG